MANTEKGSRIKQGAAARTGFKKTMARADLHISVRLKVAATRAAVTRQQTLSGLIADALMAYPAVQTELEALRDAVFEDEEEGEK
jgi:hypothetical protein